MSLLFSRRCEYALQAVLFVALTPDGSLTSIKEMTAALGIPYHFLAKILQDLSRKGLLVSHTGPQGGFGLGIDAEKITLMDIVEAIDGPGITSRCVLGFHDCSDTRPCSLHEKWTGLRDGLKGMLMSRNISQLALDMKKPGYGSFPPKGNVR